MTRSAHILIVEDDPEIRLLMKRHLTAQEFRVTVAADGTEMDRLLASGRFDLMVLDIMLPGEDGISLCRRVRATSTLPIIIVSARTEDIDRVIGLEVGADDYMTKPFNPRELIARVRALLRRVEMGQATPAAAPKTLRFEGWEIDCNTRSLTNPQKAMVSLTPGEFNLLQVMVERSGHVLSRDQLVDLTYGQIGATNGRSIDILVSRLRSKLQAGGAAYQFIVTVRSGGYEFVAPTEAVAADG
ncbi:response regulator [Roseibium sp.]|uniref:response regulator n=1 Tax=Roseibium sp. TaxID=1936156 RepID=UPI003B522DDF